MGGEGRGGVGRGEEVRGPGEGRAATVEVRSATFHWF